MQLVTQLESDSEGEDEDAWTWEAKINAAASARSAGLATTIAPGWSNLIRYIWDDVET